MTNLSPNLQATRTNAKLDEHVARILDAAQLSPEQVQTALAEARTLAGQHLSAGEEDAFVRLRDGLEARGVLNPEQTASLNRQIEAERQLRGAFVDAATKAGRKHAVIAGVVGVLLSGATLAAFAAAPEFTDAAGLWAASNVTVNLLALIGCRAFVAGAELDGARYGVNEFEAEFEAKLPKQA